MKYIRFALLCALTFTSFVSAQIFIFDIHGVLLHENLANYVKGKVSEKLAALDPTKHNSRSLRDCRPYKLLCQVMKEKNILADLDLPFDTYPGDGCHYPLETFLMFAGHVHPDEVYKRTKKALRETVFDQELDFMLVDTLVDAIFDRKEFLNTIVELREGIELLTALAAHKEHTIYVLSNAPDPWIQLYLTQFASIFGLLEQDHILSSGKLGFLKPNKKAFQAIADHCNADLSDLYLIDDTQKNVTGAVKAGLQALCFDYKQFSEIVDTLHAQGHLSNDAVTTMQKNLIGKRTQVAFGERTLY